MQARYEHIVKELRCLVCQNESIADSNALLAATCGARCAR
jgi:cytochrome c-type biogenesis protein CcmH